MSKAQIVALDLTRVLDRQDAYPTNFAPSPPNHPQFRTFFGQSLNRPVFYVRTDQVPAAEVAQGIISYRHFPTE